MERPLQGSRILLLVAAPISIALQGSSKQCAIMHPGARSHTLSDDRLSSRRERLAPCSQVAHVCCTDMHSVMLLTKLCTLCMCSLGTAWQCTQRQELVNG